MYIDVATCQTRRNDATTVRSVGLSVRQFDDLVPVAPAPGHLRPFIHRPELPIALAAPAFAVPIRLTTVI